MLNQTLITIFHRDLNKLKEELNAYHDEAALWKVEAGISNSAGNLALHLIGNLNHFIGATLGNTGYVRQRENEFAFKNVPRHEIIRSIDDTIKVVQETLDKISDADMDNPFPFKLPLGDGSTRYMLVHLTTHLGYHLGQINYHRRLIGK